MESNKMEVAKQLILKRFSFLEKKGYSIEFETENDKLFSEYLIVKYKNPEKKREISISYTKGKIYEDIKYSFGVSIVRTPDKRIEDFFSLYIFLESAKRDFFHQSCQSF